MKLSDKKILIILAAFLSIFIVKGVLEAIDRHQAEQRMEREEQRREKEEQWDIERRQEERERHQLEMKLHRMRMENLQQQSKSKKK